MPLNIDPTPRNRKETGLAVLQIQVEHADGILEFNPTSSLMTGIQTPEAILDLKPIPELKSLITGGPAIIYRSDDLEIPLTQEETLRLMLTALRPKEYEAIATRYGDAYEWHDDFYDSATGDALQSREIYMQQAKLQRELGDSADVQIVEKDDYTQELIVIRKPDGDDQRGPKL
ncbi:conserved hypothetical protein [Hyphomicrobiales bacterium]|nr:conserved hypothetical protein [Hyphomicrobiales bacterium]CAH1702358.1 hypothetical protein BOSEA1005_30230 [Hyphomicrobiales bacterium]CAI0346558.1 conserved hypothetical protein [Hyphomicrobiales bacterium]